MQTDLTELRFTVYRLKSPITCDSYEEQTKQRSAIAILLHAEAKSSVKLMTE